jgi:hypothetical protein
MARLKTLQFHLTLTPLFTATHALFFLSFTIFSPWSVIGVFGLFSCDPRFMAHIDSPWFVKFSKMTNTNFCESWFGFFFINWDLWPETHLPFNVFVYWKKISQILQSQIMGKKWWKREKIMHAWQWKGEWGSDEIAMFLTLPWKMCLKGLPDKIRDQCQLQRKF